MEVTSGCVCVCARSICLKDARHRAVTEEGHVSALKDHKHKAAFVLSDRVAEETRGSGMAPKTKKDPQQDCVLG